MPRLPRAVFAGVPHHITQRGNRRSDVFFTDEDRVVYLDWLHEYCEKHNVDVLAYCLMTNHIHMVAVPNTPEGLQRVLKPLHMRYAQRVNRAQGWKGHLWQGRFFSSPLDEAYLYSAIRYVERNPIRVGLADKAEDYLWSSAGAHCGLREDVLLSKKVEWEPMLAAIGDWSGWLSVEEEPKCLDVLRQHVEKGVALWSRCFCAGSWEKDWKNPGKSGSRAT